MVWTSSAFRLIFDFWYGTQSTCITSNSFDKETWIYHWYIHYVPYMHDSMDGTSSTGINWDCWCSRMQDVVSPTHSLQEVISRSTVLPVIPCVTSTDISDWCQCLQKPLKIKALASPIYIWYRQKDVNHKIQWKQMLKGMNQNADRRMFDKNDTRHRLREINGLYYDLYMF